MNDENMSDLLKQFNNMINSGIVPDNVKEILGNISSSSSSNTSENSSAANLPPSSSIDVETIIKLKSVMDKLNSKDDARANLLLSLKPYLNNNRKGKLDQYIQFLNISKVLEAFNSNGGNINK